MPRVTYTTGTGGFEVATNITVNNPRYAGSITMSEPEWLWTSTGITTSGTNTATVTYAPPFHEMWLVGGTETVMYDLDWRTADWEAAVGHAGLAGVRVSPSHPPGHTARQNAARRRQGLAETRAEGLLERCLGRQAVLDWRRYGSVRVVGSLGGVYEVGPSGRGWSGQVVQIRPDGGLLTRWCCHATMRDLPILDQVISLAMQIVADEAHFQSIANNHGATGAPEFERRLKARRLFKEAA